MNKIQGTRLRNNLIYFSNIVSLAAIWSHTSDALEELFESGEDEDNAVLKEAGFTEKEINKLGRRWDSDYASMIAEEGEFEGFLVEATIPVPEDTKVEDDIVVHGTYTWGYRRSKWFFVQTLDEAVEKAVAWKHKECLEAHQEAKRP